MAKAQFFQSSSKLADMICFNHDLLSVIERLGIKLGFGDSNVSDVCRKFNLSHNLFLMICNTYSFKEYMPDINTLTEDDIAHIIDYLKTSHAYYSNVLFPKLHSNIHRMVEACNERSQTVLNKFYDDYEDEVFHHFEYEETVVFPYIQSLVNASASVSSDFNITVFENNHTNIDEKLNDLKNIIIKYIPEESSSAARFEAINHIFQVDRDLNRHTLVENKILIPLVAKLEPNE